MSTTITSGAVMTATDETRLLHGYALQAVDTAIRDAAIKIIPLPDGAARDALAAQLGRLYDRRLDLISQHIETIVNSADVQEALRGLTAVVADLEAAAERLRDATNFLKQITKVAGFAKKAVEAIEGVKEEGKEE